VNEHLKIGDLIELEIKRLGINGEGIGYYEKLAIFVDYALPDEHILIEITKVFDNRAEAKIKKILKENPDRKTPFCKVYEQCGGCQTQHFDYFKTLIQKRQIIIHAYDRYVYPKIDVSVVKRTIGAQKSTHYRNKASLPVQKINGKNRFGMYAANSRRFIAIDDCPVQIEAINVILNQIVLLMDKYHIDAYDQKSKKGFVKSLVVRYSEQTQEAQVSMILIKPNPNIQKLADELAQIDSRIVSIFVFYKKKDHSQNVFSNDKKCLYGKETMQEKLNNSTFLIKPEAFFQLNVPQAHIFYQKMHELATLSKNDIVVDAYAGIAPISHYVYQDAKHVYAIEIDHSACESAMLSLKSNQIRNVTVLKSDFRRALLAMRNKVIQVMFFDPPRTGLGQETIETVLEFLPEKIVYGSCNPSTLAKDIHQLQDAYELIETVPIDMFPYTSLVESVSLLVRKKQIEDDIFIDIDE
jgi:23S rRNA (uracil1939-C5)-methyltransferase